MSNREHGLYLVLLVNLTIVFYDQLHVREAHPDIPLLQHAKELIAKLDALGITPSPPAEGDVGGEDDDWEDVEGSEDEDGDIDMA
jgi:hypothetical protein